MLFLCIRCSILAFPLHDSFAPGNYFDERRLNPNRSRAMAALRAQYHLDRPLARTVCVLMTLFFTAIWDFRLRTIPRLADSFRRCAQHSCSAPLRPLDRLGIALPLEFGAPSDWALTGPPCLSWQRSAPVIPDLALALGLLVPHGEDGWFPTGSITSLNAFGSPH